MNFLLNLKLPICGYNISLKELTFKQFRDFNKYISNNADNLTEQYIDSIIQENIEQKSNKNLTGYDKFCCMLMLRCSNISPNIDIFDKISTVKIPLLPFLNKCLNFQIDSAKEIITHEGITVKVSLPDTFLQENILELPINVIQEVKIQGNIYKFKDIRPNEQERFINELPGSLIFDIKQYYMEICDKFKDLKFNLPTTKDLKEQQVIELNPFNGSFLELIKLLFKISPQDLYELQYLLVSKIGYSAEYIDNNTFIENNILLRLYENEQKKIEQQNKTPGIPLHK